MAIPTYIHDSESGVNSTITKYGQIVVAPISYSSSTFKKLALAATGYNFVTPKAGKQIVITDIVVITDKDVSATVGAEIELYTATSDSSTTVVDTILKLELIKQKSVVLNGLNLITDGGVFLNGKTSDAGVFVTMMYYYVEER